MDISISDAITDEKFSANADRIALGAGRSRSDIWNACDAPSHASTITRMAARGAARPA